MSKSKKIWSPAMLRNRVNPPHEKQGSIAVKIVPADKNACFGNAEGSV
jgi:hypothetical protein